MSQHTSPLRELLKKDTIWTEAHQACFDKVKSLICETTTLQYFDPHKESVIQVDASNQFLGAALTQDNKPIAFASKSLTETEKRYANIERELLAVVFGCERFHTYIFGKPFIVESDHKPLEMIKLKNLVAAPPRLQRMLLRLQNYDITIRYRPGQEMVLADSLSRLPNPDVKEEIPLDVRVSPVQFSTDKLIDLRQETRKDSILHALNYRDELSVDNSLIMKGDRVLIPRSKQQEILEKLHAGHQGSTKCKQRARTCVFWEGINQDIDKFTSTCSICQEHQNSQQKETLHPHEIPTRPWQVLGTDIFYFNSKEHLIISDYYTKFPFVRVLPQPCTSKAVIGVLKNIFAEQGIPERLISDNGRHFDSEDFRTFTGNWTFDHITSSPTYPQSNGFIERQIQTVKKTLTKANESSMDLDMALLCLRTTPIDNILPTPAELLYGRKLKSNLPLKIPNNIADRDIINNRLRERRDTQKYYYDRTAKDLPDLIPGQSVQIQNHTTGRWTPAIVRGKCTEPRSYTVETNKGSTLRRNRRHIVAAPRSPTRVTFHDQQSSPDISSQLDHNRLMDKQRHPDTLLYDDRLTVDKHDYYQQACREPAAGQHPSRYRNCRLLRLPDEFQPTSNDQQPRRFQEATRCEPSKSILKTRSGRTVTKPVKLDM